MSGQSGKTRAESVAVTCDPNSSRANVASVVKAASSVNRWLPPPRPDAGREPGTDRDEDQQGDQQHRRGEVRRDRLAAVAEPDRLAPEPRLEADQGDRADRRPEQGSAVAMVDAGEDRQAEDLEADDHGDRPVDPLDPRLRVVERRQQLAVAERPVRAAETGVRRAHDDADRDEQDRGPERQRGELLEAGQRVSWGRVDGAERAGRILARRGTPAERHDPVRGVRTGLRWPPRLRFAHDPSHPARHPLRAPARDRRRVQFVRRLDAAASPSTSSSGGAGACPVTPTPSGTPGGLGRQPADAAPCSRRSSTRPGRSPAARPG